MPKLKTQSLMFLKISQSQWKAGTFYNPYSVLLAVGVFLECSLDEHKNLGSPLFIPVLANFLQASEDALLLLLTYDYITKMLSICKNFTF